MEKMVEKVLGIDLGSLRKPEAETSVALAVKYLLAKKDWKRLSEVALKAAYDFEVKGKGPIQRLEDPVQRLEPTDTQAEDSEEEDAEEEIVGEADRAVTADGAKKKRK